MKEFKVLFDDNTVFIGKQLEGDWRKIPEDKKIIRLEYILGNHKIILTGYKQYNHLIEQVSFVVQKITNIFLMAREESRTFIITFNIKNKKITKRYVPIGKEYNNQILAGWKDGRYNQPKAYMVGIGS